MGTLTKNQRFVNNAYVKHNMDNMKQILHLYNIRAWNSRKQIQKKNNS